MCNRLFVVLSFLTLLLACKNKTVESIDIQAEPAETVLLTEKDVSKFKYNEYILDSKTKELVKDWIEYKQLTDVVSKIKKGDLTFIDNNDEDIALLISEQILNIPEALKSDAIISRLVILETRLLKLISLANLSSTNKTEFLKNTKAFLEAYSNLNFHMNKKVEFDNKTIERP